MQSHHRIISVCLFKGGIVAITDDGSVWQWKQDMMGDWFWSTTGRIADD